MIAQYPQVVGLGDNLLWSQARDLFLFACFCRCVGSSDHYLDFRNIETRNLDVEV
jgi:hypothetical protein